MYLFFDTETTGLPANFNAPHTQVDNWPRMVQLAWSLYDENEMFVSQSNDIIKPEGYRIPLHASKIHGITTEYALKNGVNLKTTLKKFSEALDDAQIIIAHNIAFDEKIIGAELIRKNVSSALFKTQRFCTMKSTIDFCKIPGYRGHKWPKLSELHEILFNQGFEDAHNAEADTQACAKCFFELKRRGIIDVIT
ncbi:MAG: 3'-5' exonuclease [Candidatus Nanohalarchaeota archaeon]|nr:MAG: 3'-5' exonuclease [Candidatus Nanohaloarchaeota archaeon]